MSPSIYYTTTELRLLHQNSELTPWFSFWVDNKLKKRREMALCRRMAAPFFLVLLIIVAAGDLRHQLLAGVSSFASIME
jgi:hypothetical protein